MVGWGVGSDETGSRELVECLRSRSIWTGSLRSAGDEDG